MGSISKENAERTRRVRGASRTAAMSQAEIGARFGVSLQAIQFVERRALAKIKRAIERFAREDGVSVREWLFPLG